MKVVVEENLNIRNAVNHNGVNPRKVNITTLIARYKKEKAKERVDTIVFVSLASLLVIVTGVLISL